MPQKAKKDGQPTAKLSESLVLGINPNELAIKALKLRWFDIALKENYPKTEAVTKELDNLEKAIKELEDIEANKLANK